jgi:hypothetical protein
VSVETLACSVHDECDADASASAESDQLEVYSGDGYSESGDSCACEPKYVGWFSLGTGRSMEYTRASVETLAVSADAEASISTVDDEYQPEGCSGDRCAREPQYGGWCIGTGNVSKNAESDTWCTRPKYSCS